jgi:hypothetical protein
MPDERKWIGPQEIGRILEAVHAAGVHLEAARVPLDAEGEGRVAIESGRLVVVAPARGDLDAFVATLPARIRALPGAGALKRAE